MARPTKLTPEAQEGICKALRYGIPIEVACGIEGIGRQTYYDWKKRGENGEEPFAGFLDAAEKAMDKVEAQVTANVLVASQKHWQAGAWWLRFRKTGGKQQVELTGKDGAPLTGPLTPEAAEVIRQKILYGERPSPDTDADNAKTDLADTLDEGA